ncbi:Hypothetical protein (Fragment) [Durusdinium trenchii]|uniref:Uncharacterized protein n=1 Tax=Durusdinium trenchii TaxID=1381693 RepID=A0ABP0RSP6_9DINO
MDASRSSPFRPSMGPLGAGRLRSASPSRRALAIDMRRIASLLRDPAGALHGPHHEGMNNSICSSPNSAWEPGDRGAAPMTTQATQARTASLSRTIIENQFTALAERINAGVTTLQRQCELDRRRLTQVEKKLDAKTAEADKHDGRERWAEVQGSVSGLLEETQALARRLDGLDERLWARTSGSEASKQRNRDLEQQVQALEQQNRLAAAAAEELQKRQATKIRRTEHSMEEVMRRMEKLEEELRQRAPPQRDGYMEAKFIAFEQNQEALDTEIRALQANLEDGLQQLREEFKDGQSAGALEPDDRALSALERKVTGQVEEVSSNMASLRVKVDRLMDRVGSLAERIETAHEPSIDSLRVEISQARGQERRELDAEIQSLKSRLQHTQDSTEETCIEVREALRQARAETAALSYRPDIQEDSSWMRTTEERLAGHEQDLFDLRERVEELIQGDPDGKPLRDNEDVENIRRRLEVLEEQGTAVEDPETTRMVQVQNTICDLVEQVSKLKQHASSAEANSSSWQQQVKQIHSLIERKQNEDAASLRVNGEVEAKVGALSSQVADIAARLLEVEGNLDFVRETEQSSLTEAPNSGVAGPGTQGSGGGNAALQEKLEAVALHLEIVDDLTERLGDLERKWNAGPEPHGMGSPPGPLSEVSFGGEAPVKASAPSDHLGRELGDLQLRFDANDTKLKSIHEELRTKLALAKADSQGTQAQLNDLAARLGGDEQILSTLQEAPAVSFADLDALRLEFADKFDQMQPSTEQVEPETKDTSLIAGELMEVKHVVKELSEKVNSNHLNLDDLQESLAQLAANTKAFEATVPGMKEEIKELRSRLPNADAEASAEQAILEKLEEVDADLKYCKFECGTFAKGGDLGHLRDRVKELEEIAQKPTKGERMIKDVQELIKGKYQQQEEIMKDLKKFYELEARFDATKVETDTELQKLCAMINDLQKEQIEEPKEGESNLESMADLKDQIAALEQKIDSVSGEHVIDRAEASAEDVKLRSQVQQQVQDIGMQLSKEVANLAEHQRDLVETRCSLEDLNKKFDDVTGLENQITHVAERLSSTESVVSTAKKELEDMRTEVTNLLGRITSTESSSCEMKKDLEGLLGPRNKIGISLNGASQSPLDEIRGRLDILSEQLAELQSKQDFPAAPATHVAHKDSVASGDGSLNFSLTEHTERPGAPDGSLNFSLTETAKDVTEKRFAAPSPYITAEADSASDVLSDSASPASSAGRIAQSLTVEKDAPPSAPDSPNSGQKGASSSQVSASFNEMSICPDQSVELSTELEQKCDFVEEVRPVSKPRSDRGIASSPIKEEEEIPENADAKAEPARLEPGQAASQLRPLGPLPSRPTPAPLDSLDSLSKPKQPMFTATKADAADALDVLLKPKAKTLPPLTQVDESKPKEPISVTEHAAEKEKKEDDEEEEKEKKEEKMEKEEEEDDEYENSFDDDGDDDVDDNMSVPPESIHSCSQDSV